MDGLQNFRVCPAGLVALFSHVQNGTLIQHGKLPAHSIHLEGDFHRLLVQGTERLGDDESFTVFGCLANKSAIRAPLYVVCED